MFLKRKYGTKKSESKITWYSITYIRWMIWFWNKFSSCHLLSPPHFYVLASWYFSGTKLLSYSISNLVFKFFPFNIESTISHIIRGSIPCLFVGYKIFNWVGLSNHTNYSFIVKLFNIRQNILMHEGCFPYLA